MRDVLEQDFSSLGAHPALFLQRAQHADGGFNRGRGQFRDFAFGVRQLVTVGLL